MPRVVVIGYGNPLRGDDAIGWIAAKNLDETLNNPEITVIFSHQLTPELSQTLSEHDRAIFIDSVEGPDVGRLQIRLAQPALQINSNAFSHQATPEGLLAQAKLLYGRAPQAYLCTMECQDFDIKEGLSSKVQDKLPDLLKMIKDLAENDA